MAKTNISDIEHKRMTETPIARLVVALSIPTVISMLMTSIYNMADTYFVSSLGDSPVGAVGIVFSLQSIIQAVGFGLSMGCGSLVSIKLGEKKNSEANKFLSTAFFTAFICGAIIMGACFIDLDALLLFFGSTKTILPYARGYATVILIAAPFMCSLYVINNSLRSQGKATFSMIANLVGGMLNIILDPIFIFTLDMGVVGAAIATAISQLVSFAISLSFYFGKRSILLLSPRFISRCPYDYWLIIKTGAPTVFRQGLGSVSTTLLNIQVKPFGDAAIAAVSLANKVYMIVRSIVLGIGQGFQPVAGYNYGARKNRRVKEAFRVAVILGSTVACIGAALVAIFPTEVMELFRDEGTQTVEIGARMLRYLALCLPFLGYSSYVNMMYQSLGFVKGATFLASCRQGVFFIPLIYLLPYLFGLEGIIMTQSAADILTFLISIPFHIIFVKKFLKDNENSQGL